ncbi:MAG: VWA domain-containing protein [Bdellovibrionaceae bacterium]|nr:VWA domain-containing protein [Pseudobdellovibrionaceae bacterium]MBX3034190.1 VWA domain-containing protein [Pseudobdellovibrionaceae bacterium]
MFRFENPAAFMWLWLIPLYGAMVLIALRWERKRLAKGLGPRLAPFLTRSISTSKRRWKIFFQMTAVFFAVLAMARPQMGESKQEIRSEGIEIILAVDVSESMMAEDVKPSRLEQAKIELGRLVDLMPGNKIGVMAFAGSAALLSPLTNDPAAIKMYLESLSTDSVSSQGTCFECVLSAAADAFERGGVSADDTVKVTRAVVIASDGEDHEQGALDTARTLKDKGIRVFTVAYGTEKGGTIPVRDGMGYMRGYKKDNAGQVVISQVRGDFLRQLAAAGGGSFSFSSFGGQHVRRLADELGALEKSQFETTVATQYDERFQWFLLVALLFASADLALGERRAGFRLWKGRFEVPPG